MKPGRDAGTRFDATTLLSIPAILYFVIAVAIPLALLLAASVTVGGKPSLANYTRFLSDAYNIDVLLTTLAYGLIVTTLTFLVGFPYAFALSRATPWLQSLLLLAIFLPMTTSVIVKAFGWTILLKRDGLINQTLIALGLTSQPLPLLFSRAGLYLGTASILLPYMVLPILNLLRTVALELMDAAATLGAGPFFTLRRVLLPLILPGIVSGVAFVFSMTVSAYVIPTLLTGAGFHTLSKALATAFLVVDDRPKGATISVLLLALAGGVVGFGTWLAARLETR